MRKTIGEKVERLWREALREGWGYARYCEEYLKLMRGER